MLFFLSNLILLLQVWGEWVNSCSLCLIFLTLLYASSHNYVRKPAFSLWDVWRYSYTEWVWELAGFKSVKKVLHAKAITSAGKHMDQNSMELIKHLAWRAERKWFQTGAHANAKNKTWAKTSETDLTSHTTDQQSYSVLNENHPPL